jgi:hypothetical protein
MKVQISIVQCGYHLGTPVGCRLVQLRPSINSKEWQHPKWICDKCREYLKGLFKYATQ